jgi:hypothetical protein
MSTLMIDPPNNVSGDGSTFYVSIICGVGGGKGVVKALFELA